MPILTIVGELQEALDLALQRYTIEPSTANIEELRRNHDMAMNLERIGHCLLRVRDVECSKRFYMDILGFQLMEQDPEHGGSS